jgi:hypothetical protein
MNTQSIGHIVMDRNWWANLSWRDRFIIRLFRGTMNTFCKYVICRAMERGIVGPIAFHELAAICDRSLWPERYQKDQDLACCLCESKELPGG